MSKKIKIFTLMSVILNVVLIGIIAGHGSHRYGMKHQGYNGKAVIKLIEKTSLPEEKQTSLKKLFHRNAPETKKMAREKMVKKEQFQEEVFSVLTAKEFDAKAFRALIETKHSAFQKRKQHMTDAIVEIASNLDQKERKKLAKALRKKPFTPKKPM